jgi:AhpD family alkylhydroperoxidase
MPRIRPLTKGEAPEAARPFLEAAEKVFGTPSIPAGVQAYCPPILEASRALYAAPGKSGQLPQGLRSLVCVRAAQIVACPFWIDSNAAGSSAAGTSDEKIAAVATWRDSALFSPAERAALEIAEGLTKTPANVSEALFGEARRHFTDAQLVELAATIAMENYRARLNRMFLIESQGLYKPKRWSTCASARVRALIRPAKILIIIGLEGSHFNA